uniref:ATP-grasp domain-containing protein n=1 Tax=Noctiluca scintillans TaxID=2966 RepID=A0A7S1F3N2_NOCSC
MPRSDFVALLQAISSKHNFTCTSLSHDWIIQITDPLSGRVCNIFGYTFDVNGAGAHEVCKEKAATAQVLEARGVPCIPHHVFLSPSNPFTAEYLPRKGNSERLRQLVETVGWPVVVKPLKGTGGAGVVKATCWKELEAAVQVTFGIEYGLAVSPYKKIVDEYRCVCLDGKVELVYRKVRKHVIGDGLSTLAELITKAMAAVNSIEAAALASAAVENSVEAWSRVPQSGEEVPLQWKHNLGQGASVDLQVPQEKQAQVEVVAVAAAKAIGVRFCSADVVEVDGEGMIIMEVNGGVMMDSLLGQLGDQGQDLATRIYETAVLSALAAQAVPPI